jgi:hypothetical protein
MQFQTPVLAALALSYLPRIICSWRFDRAWLACLMNPVSILMFLAIQWTALIRKSRGKRVAWRQRNYEMAAS